MKTQFICAILLICCAIFLSAHSKVEDLTTGPAPVPPAELGLNTIQASELANVSNNGETLEGAIFARNGDLLFCDVSGKRVMRLSPDNKLSTILELEDFAPCGLALHKDGRLFIVANNLQKKAGVILALNTDGKTIETIIPVEAGYFPNDLVFDANGGFYFSDFKGGATQPTGGVYYARPGFGAITPVIPNMAQANGVALSPDGKILWATEYANNRLHRVILSGPAEVGPTGSHIAYNFIGPAPDSMRVDSEGNAYVAMVGQGRVMIFNAQGFPIGQILLPQRNLGNNLRSTSLAIHPTQPELRIVSGNTVDAASRAAAIFKAQSLAPGL